MCGPKGKYGCQYFILLTLKKKFMDTVVLDFFNKKVILDYYFCLKSGPVILFQIFIIICIKDFNAEKNTSLKLNLFYFFICGCQHHQRKTICLYVYISDIRQIVGYRTSVFIQRFPWRLHIAITYNLPHLRLVL